MNPCDSPSSAPASCDDAPLPSESEASFPSIAPNDLPWGLCPRITAPRSTGHDPYSDLSMQINTTAIERLADRMRARARMPCPAARRAPAAARALATAPPRSPSSPPAFMQVPRLSPAPCPTGPAAAAADACPAVLTPCPLPWAAVRGFSPPQPRVTH